MTTVDYYHTFEERCWLQHTRYVHGHIINKSDGFLGGVRHMTPSGICRCFSIDDADVTAHLSALRREADSLDAVLLTLGVDACSHLTRHIRRSINGELICDQVLHRVRFSIGSGSHSLSVEIVGSTADLDRSILQDNLTRLRRWRRSLENTRSDERRASSVILDHECSGVLVTMLMGYLLEGDRVASNTSFAVQHCAGKRFSLPLFVTDVLDAAGPIQVARDEEGTVPAKRISLVQAGQFNTVLTDMSSSSALGITNNGRSRSAGYQFVPTPRLTNVDVGDGADSLESLLSSQPDALYIEGMAGAAVDVASGIIHLNGVMGTRFRRGEVVDSVAAPGLSLEIRDFLVRLAGLGKRDRWSCRPMGKGRPLQNCEIGYRCPQLMLDLKGLP